MTAFEFKALNEKGKNITGIINADSPANARQKLREEQKFPTSITEVQSQATLKNNGRFGGLSIFNRVPSGEIAMVTRQLATLVGANFPLDSALNVLIPQTRSTLLKKKLAHIKDAITEGGSLSGALADQTGTFGPLFVNMVKVGEASGTLSIVLDRLAEITEKQQEIKDKIRAAMAYPVLMLLIGIIVLFLLLTFIIPSITSIFEDMNQVLPAPTRILIAAGMFFKSWWWTGLILFPVLIIGFRWFKKTRRGRQAYDRMVLNLPVAGTLVVKLAVARIARTLSSLLENGVSMLTALDIVKGVPGNVHVEAAVTAASGRVAKGRELSQALDRGPIFPGLFIQMVKVGEETAELEEMLRKVAEVYEKEVEARVTGLASLVEPLMILGMGLVVGFIVLSICLPIFEMNQLIQ